jgi:glycosyltransferase involved in cell wall biosynthesis
VTPATSPPLRIGVDARYLRRQGVGIARYLDLGVRNLVEAGTRVTLVTDDERHRGELCSAYPLCAAVALPGRSGFWWEQAALRRHLGGAGYDAFVAPANYGLPLAYRGRTRLLLVVHDLIPLRLPHRYLLTRPAWAAKYLLSVGIAALRADRVVAVSDASARDVARLLRRTARVVYPEIPLPCADQCAAAADATAVTAAAAVPAGPYYVYNGGTDPRKNVPMLLRALALVHRELPGTRLVMLGPDYAGFDRLISRLGIDEHVLRPGYVPEAIKAEIIRGSVALVYPSRLEGFGLPVVEAMAAGVPVVSGTGGALAEVGGRAAIYPRELSARGLAAAMISVTEPGVRDKSRRAGDSQLRALRGRQQASTLAGAVAECVADSARRQRAVT